MIGLDNPIHLALLLMILLLVFGAKRLPEMGRSLGAGLRGFKESVSGVTPPEPMSVVSAPEQVAGVAAPGQIGGLTPTGYPAALREPAIPEPVPAQVAPAHTSTPVAPEPRTGAAIQGGWASER
ncbi:MAG TPA: twin-arginine translocase TatA/TatE family subunit [Solirubrobacteraceae bacterium]|nr:twin-arginine translocase TatA/TatE family subunit [Solirubrobacteraceae bacterium]